MRRHQLSLCHSLGGPKCINQSLFLYQSIWLENGFLVYAAHEEEERMHTASVVFIETKQYRDLPKDLSFFIEVPRKPALV